MRGRGSFDRALAGADTAKHGGVPVEFCCTVGRHNARSIEALIDLAETMKIPIVFQPALNSLFLDTVRDGSSWQLESHTIRQAFARIGRSSSEAAVSSAMRGRASNTFARSRTTRALHARRAG